MRRSTSAPPYSTSIGRASGAAKISQGNNNLQTNMDYPLDNCGPENGLYFLYTLMICDFQIIFSNILIAIEILLLNP